MKSTLRWILVLPTGVFSALVASITVYLVVMRTLGGGGQDPTIEIGNAAYLNGIVQYSRALVCPICFVLGCAAAAPVLKARVALACGLLVLALLAGWSVYPGSGMDVHMPKMLLNLAGVVAGSIWVWKTTEPDPEVAF